MTYTALDQLSKEITKRRIEREADQWTAVELVLEAEISKEGIEGLVGGSSRGDTIRLRVSLHCLQYHNSSSNLIHHK